MGEEPKEMQWLILVYQFPQVPGSLRVRIWRRLQGIGAIAIKNSMYALPLNEQAREDFQWLLTELTSNGADGAILESRFIDGLSDSQVRALFNAARDADYSELTDEIGTALPDRSTDTELEDETLRDIRRALSRARRRLTEIEAIDFFGAANRKTAERALRSLEELMMPNASATETRDGTMATTDLKDLSNRVWVTRRNVRVDRIGSAWLIRRWIDPDAVFKFVDSKGYQHGRRELRFDMYEAEFGHKADLCTFEVLAETFRPDDAALQAIAEIVHDIDLKDNKFGRAETQGIANLLTGIVAGIEDDDRRINRGSEMLDDLYRYFSETSD